MGVTELSPSIVASSNRPVHEVLFPPLRNVQHIDRLPRAGSILTISP